VSSVVISELKTTGLNLFEDKESYLDEVNETELTQTIGGATPVSVVATVQFAGGLIQGAAASVALTAGWAVLQNFKKQNP
jgi:hypothetical protein